MTIKHTPEFERALRIELLRARAAVERQQIAQSSRVMVSDLSPSQMLAQMLPGNARAWLARGLGLVTRYPNIVSTLISNRRFKAVRWVSVAALAVGAWSLLRGEESHSGEQDESA